ncbi:MAG: leucyl aminopeptidase family protein [Hyphomicrobiales bacterium]|nr:leucyl aminopeptidase family protein [Hyphomicrobiales bacterium]
MSSLFAAPDASAIPVRFVDRASWPVRAARLAAPARGWAEATGFTGEAGAVLLVPAPDGRIAEVHFGVEPAGSRKRDPFGPGKLATVLPAGVYAFDLEGAEAATAALAFLLGAYRFDRFREPKPARARIVAPAGVDAARIESIAAAVRVARDLVNRPANDLTPTALEDAARDVAERCGAKIKVVRGEALLAEGFPLIHAVGRAAADEPRLVDFAFGPAGAKTVTLVGKGVCFDTGGLDIKPGHAMLLMKKDMGGAAHVFGLAQMIMAHNLPVNLRVLAPAVENSTGGNSYRPSDIIKTRKGLSVEIGNTDAEGRIVLADALEEASRENPALLVDFATLTGAARVALGPDLPAMFCNDDALADALLKSARAAEDPLWRLPLWQPYKGDLRSKVADSNNVGPGSHAGAIVAALFLEKFVGNGIPWVHIDTFAWNPRGKPGRPEGGEALGMRAVFDLIRKKFGRK